MMGTRTSGYVYLLHFNSPLVGGEHQSRHYVGWARNWVYRVQAHRRGTSHARIMEVLWERGYTFQVAVVVKGSPSLERTIKRAHHHARYCPLCGGHKLTDYREVGQMITRAAYAHWTDTDILTIGASLNAAELAALNREITYDPTEIRSLLGWPYSHAITITAPDPHDPDGGMMRVDYVADYRSELAE